jgi:hypothetical protein
MHLLARSQGVATLANAFHDDEFVQREVEEMGAWLRSCAGGPSKRARRRAERQPKTRTGERARRKQA